MARRRSSLLIQELKKEGRRSLTVNNNKQFDVEDIYEKCTSSKLVKKLKTGILFDEQFTQHKCTWDPLYPEKPERYTCIMDRLNEYLLVDRCERIPSRFATREELCTKHDSKLVDVLESTTRITEESELESLASKFDAVYFNQATYQSALLAAGSAIELVENVVKNKVQNGMALIRPPGHHATHDQFCGYCYFNNVALAAQYALDKLNLKKILIVDWDVHHGQATQRMFYEDPRVLYFSIHRYENGSFWPNLRESNFDFVGSDPGSGYNINVPLNEIGCGDADYLTIFHSVLLPVAYEFEPDLVLVSAGFDAAVGCTEGQMLVSPACYHHLTTSLMGLAGGKIVVLLEGGYFLPSLAESAAQTLRALLGDPAPMLEPVSKPKQSVLCSIYNVISILRTKWNCFHYFRDNEKSKDCKEHKVEVLYTGEEEKPPFPTRSCYPMHSESKRKAFEEKVRALQSKLYKNPPVNKVAYVYNSVMELHNSPTVSNFERPERLIRTLEILTELNILPRLELQSSRDADRKEISSVHDEEYINKIAALGPCSESDLSEKEGWTTVFTNADTMKSATLAVGCLIDLVQSVIEGKISHGVGLIRPPGHHAETQAAGGFCIFNNVAIAAKHALLQGLNRILIIDWDIHHGNGIQHVFYDDPRVLYLSLHRYDDGTFYPYSSDADYAHRGADSGLGYNVNIAWNCNIMSDADYMSAFTRVVLPIAYQFNPELVLVAAGFDACKGDPLGGYSVTPEAYGHFVQLLKPLAAGRIIIALEGGYNINSVGYSMAMCCKALLNDPLPPLKYGRASDSATHSIENTIRVHVAQWFLLLKDVRFITEDSRENA